MNLVLDVGNTKVKLAVFNGKDMIFRTEALELDNTFLESFVSKRFDINSCVISSVRSSIKNEIELLNEITGNVVMFSHKTPIPVKNLYRTPHTLGLDRLAAVIGAADLFPNENALVIDAGTAITYDFVSAKSEYHGGNISPGLNTRFKALHNFTGKLPLLSPKKNTVLFGTDTASAIIAGVQNGIVFEVQAYIDALLQDYKQIKVVFTGGDADFFDKKIKSTIFVDQNLVLKGLNKVLEFNL